MSDGKAPLSDIRINLGYIKPGEQNNKLMFWGNILIIISLIIVVTLLFPTVVVDDVKPAPIVSDSVAG